MADDPFEATKPTNIGNHSVAGRQLVTMME